MPCSSVSKASKRCIRCWRRTCAPNATDAASYAVDAGAVEEEKVAGAIRTDFILSAEIMAISLASITSPDILTQAIVLFAVGVL